MVSETQFSMRVDSPPSPGRHGDGRHSIPFFPKPTPTLQDTPITEGNLCVCGEGGFFAEPEPKSQTQPPNVLMNFSNETTTNEKRQKCPEQMSVIMSSQNTLLIFRDQEGITVMPSRVWSCLHCVCKTTEAHS